MQVRDLHITVYMQVRYLHITVYMQAQYLHITVYMQVRYLHITTSGYKRLKKGFQMSKECYIFDLSTESNALEKSKNSLHYLHSR